MSYSETKKDNIRLVLHRISLRFLDKNIEEKFRESYFKKSLFNVRVSISIVGILYVLFGFLDYSTSFQFYKAFLIIRFFIVFPLLLGTFLLSFTKLFIKIWQRLLSICFVVGGLGIVYMLLINPLNIVYYGGLFLIFTAGYFFIKLRFFKAVISGITILMFYNIGAFVFGPLYGTEYPNLVSTNAFFLSANIISMIALYHIESLERFDFYQKLLLANKQDEIVAINQGLEAQVIERTKLLHERTKLLHERNKALTKEVDRRNEIEKNLIIAKEKAEESDRLKTAFLHNISHEIRTPMSGIFGFTELLLDSNLSGEEQEEYIEYIRRSGERMLNTVNDLVDISRIESNLVDIHLGDVNIHELSQNLYLSFRAKAERKGLKLSLNKQLTEYEAIIKSDKEKITSILSKLLDNAIKFSSEGVIEFGYTLIEDYESPELHFFVKDLGMGISSDQIVNIFDRFVQAEIADRYAYEGSGLGLSISKSYVEILGGRMWVESKLGVGSQFYFAIPYVVDNTFIEETPTIPTVNEKVTGNLKILIAEDEEAADRYFSIALRSVNNKLFHAKTGIEAIKICRENSDINLILMDINMPEMDGFTATREIRKFNKDIIIIAQTAYVLKSDREKAFDAGCNDYLTKPVKKKDLFKIIGSYFPE